jgi:hypothetical protein
MGLPAKADLTAYQGDTWAQTFRFLDDGVPVDLAGSTVTAWARSTTGEASDLAVTVGPPAGEVTIGFANGGLPRDVYDYDVEVETGGAIRSWVRGRLQVVRDVTNEPAIP